MSRSDVEVSIFKRYKDGRLTYRFSARLEPILTTACGLDGDVDFPNPAAMVEALKVWIRRASAGARIDTADDGGVIVKACVRQISLAVWSDPPPSTADENFYKLDGGEFSAVSDPLFEFVEKLLEGVS